MPGTLLSSYKEAGKSGKKYLDFNAVWIENISDQQIFIYEQNGSIQFPKFEIQQHIEIWSSYNLSLK